MNYRWFDNFVDDVADDWRNYVAMRPVSNLQNKDVVRLPSNLIDFGEEFVQEILEKQDFFTVLPSGSRIPVGVLGYKVRRIGGVKVLHVVLIQVKTTLMTMSQLKTPYLGKTELEVLLDSAAEMIHNIDYIPEDFELLIKVVSAGFAEVVLTYDKEKELLQVLEEVEEGEYEGITPSLEKAWCIGYRVSFGTSDDFEKKTAKYVRKVHELR